MNSGLSAKAAKMFSGNFNESTWNNYDNSNVFLPRDTTFTEDNLVNIIGLIESNPDIFNIAKNPYATDRQLLNAASFIFN